jgi:hypothetical protein
VPRLITLVTILAALISTLLVVTAYPSFAADGHGRSTCRISVPADPLTPAGLATPYVLRDGSADCSMVNPDTGAFVEATIFDPATGMLSVYRPLVVTQNETPAAPPTLPQLPAGAVVSVWFGFQGDALKLIGPGAFQCVNGYRGSLFGQYAYCNARAFFKAVSAAGVPAPPLGTATDGHPCPTVRDFLVVDQDQSDNVTTEYLALPDGRTMQNTAANRTAFPAATVLLNASDNGLLNRKINPALGCANFTAEDLTDPTPNQVASLALNEIQGALQAQPVALIPVNNPMTLLNGQFSIRKTALYRFGVGQPVTNDLLNPVRNARTYCKLMRTVGLPRLKADRPLFEAVTSPDPAFDSLYAFLLDRYKASRVELGC